MNKFIYDLKYFWRHGDINIQSTFDKERFWQPKLLKDAPQVFLAVMK
jgi:hypothetical protein